MPRHSVREQIVVAGLETILRQGFNGSGVQEITAAAGVPKGSFYNHFPSKEAFGAVAVDRYFEQSDQYLAILHREGMAPVERLRRYFAGQVQQIVDWKFERGCLLGNMAAEVSEQSDEIRAHVAEAFAAWSREIAAVIAEAQAAGEIAATDAPGVLADFLLAAWEGAVLRSRADKTRAALDAFLHVTVERLLI